MRSQKLFDKVQRVLKPTLCQFRNNPTTNTPWSFQEQLKTYNRNTQFKRQSIASMHSSICKPFAIVEEENNWNRHRSGKTQWKVYRHYMTNILEHRIFTTHFSLSISRHGSDKTLMQKNTEGSSEGPSTTPPAKILDMLKLCRRSLNSFGDALGRSREVLGSCLEGFETFFEKCLEGFGKIQNWNNFKKC